LVRPHTNIRSSGAKWEEDVGKEEGMNINVTHSPKSKGRWDKKSGL